MKLEIIRKDGELRLVFRGQESWRAGGSERRVEITAPSADAVEILEQIRAVADAEIVKLSGEYAGWGRALRLHADRFAALEAFFAKIGVEFDPAGFERREGGFVGIWFNHEYFYELSRDVVRVLWPEWKP